MSVAATTPARFRRARQRSVRAGAGLPEFFASSVIARLPLAMFSIALLVHARQLTGSFAAAGAASGAYAIATAVSAPVLGRLVDRYGQTRVLILGALLTAGSLLADGVLPRSAPAVLLVLLAAATGAATPPLAACVRSLLPAVVKDTTRLPAVFAFESTLLELTFIIGPALALGIGSIWSTGAALILAGLLMLVGTFAFAAHPASRPAQPAKARRPRGGALRSRALRTLILVQLALGAVFGATDVGVVVATQRLGSAAGAGALLGIWGIGSLIGGLVATRKGGPQSVGAVTALLLTLAAVHAILIVTTGSLILMGATIFAAGATIAPSLAGLYAIADSATPSGTRAEAFSWLVTAASTGTALGTSAAGALAQSSGPAGAFAVVAAAGALAVLVTLTRTHSLLADAREPTAATVSRSACRRRGPTSSGPPRISSGFAGVPVPAKRG
jgi:MFS family permease